MFQREYLEIKGLKTSFYFDRLLFDLVCFGIDLFLIRFLSAKVMRKLMQRRFMTCFQKSLKLGQVFIVYTNKECT